MSLLQGCSELEETVRLVAGLLKPKIALQVTAQAEAAAAELPQKQEPVSVAAIASEEMPILIYRGDRLEYILSTMCLRGGLRGAIVADSKGLPLADFNSPVHGDTLAAFTSVLGNALDRAGTLLGESGADLISMDINYTDKIVLRSFRVDGERYFFMVICSQNLDERVEVELSIEQIIAVLTES
jgi:predicted regulator of Ras-like GTPase activity (Roadblock/LC7/MglB family)